MRALAATGLLALAILVVATTAGGRMDVVPVGTVVLLVDVSGSTRADDVEPTRLEASIRAMRAFVDRLPPKVEVGLVSFSSAPTLLLRPNRDRAAVKHRLGLLQPEAGTALGDGLAMAARVAAEGSPRSAGGFRPAVIVLESDGAQNRGTLTPAQGAAKARDAGIRVFGVSVGTPGGKVSFGFGLFVNTIPVPPDPATIRAVARRSGGESFVAQNAAQLEDDYRQIASRLAG